MVINCLVIDDEPIARKGLMEHIREIDFLNAAGECKNSIDAGIFLQSHPVDLIFLDIQMPKINGIEFIKANQSLPPVILTTAYSEYAIEGYELDILDYLLKPISFQRFYKAALKARDFIENRRLAHQNVHNDYFFIKSNQRIEKINIQDVLYVEGMSNYIIVHTLQKKYITYLTFKGFEEQLPPSLFIRIHRSYLVAIHAIDSVNSEEVSLQNIKLPISKNFREQVMQLVAKKMFKR